MSEKTLYLTIDDGPSDRTGLLLDVLKKHDAKATFFVVGEMIKGREDMIRRIAAEGHMIGVHAFSHEYKEIYQSPEAFWQDNLLARKMIADITGFEPKIMRFPGGSSNTISRHYSPGIMTVLTRQVKEYSYEYFDWNIHPYDTTIDNEKVQDIYDLLMDGIHSANFDTPVILMHDSNKLKNQPVIIEKMLTACTAEGFIFKALDETVSPVHHLVSN